MHSPRGGICCPPSGGSPASVGVGALCGTGNFNLPSVPEAHHPRREIRGGGAADGWLGGSAGEALEFGVRWAALGRQRGVAEKVGACGLDGLGRKQRVLARRLLETERREGGAGARVGLPGRTRGGAAVGHMRERGGVVKGHGNDGWGCRLKGWVQTCGVLKMPFLRRRNTMVKIGPTSLSRPCVRVEMVKIDRLIAPAWLRSNGYLLTRPFLRAKTDAISKSTF